MQTGTAKQAAVDGFVAPEGHPLGAEHALIDAYLAEAAAVDPRLFDFKPAALPTGKELLSAPKEAQARLTQAAVERLAWRLRPRSVQVDGSFLALRGLARSLLSRQLPYTIEELHAVLTAFAGEPGLLHWLPGAALVRAAEGYVTRSGHLPPALHVALKAFLKALRRYPQAEYRKAAERVEALCRG